MVKSSKRARDLCLGVRAGPKAAMGTRRRPRTSMAREEMDQLEESQTTLKENSSFWAEAELS